MTGVVTSQKKRRGCILPLIIYPIKKINQVKIIDVKAWRTEINPHGLYRNYKLVKGATFIPVGTWGG